MADGDVRRVVEAVVAWALAAVSPEYLRTDLEVRVRAGGHTIFKTMIHPSQLEDAGPGARKPAMRHSPDFCSVRWGDEDYTFSPNQQAALRLLWEAYDNGTPGVRQETLLEAAGSEGSRLRDVFRGHAAWGNLIVPAGKGIFRLAEPD